MDGYTFRMFLSDRIKNIAPANGTFYRLMVEHHDGSSRFFPAETGAYFRVGDSPYGVPSGKYTLCFYDSEYRPLPHQDRSFDINLQSEVHRASQPQLSLHLSGAAPPGAQRADENSTGDTRLNKPPTLPQGPAKQSTDTASAADPAASAHLMNTDLEFQKYLHAMDLEERQQDFIKNSTYVTEIGELFALNRIMRREMVEMQRLIVMHSQQAYRDIEHVKGISRDFLQLQKEILASAAENVSRPPAAPPDYVGLGHSALALIKEIGVALINRSQPRDGDRQLVGNAALPQLPAHQQDATTSRQSQAADIIDKIAQKLKGSTDVDMALAMSSPEKWKALFDDLAAPAKEPATPQEGASDAKK